MPAIPITRPPSGTVACLRTPSSNSAYGRWRRSAIRRETPSISCCELGLDRRRQAGGARQELDGPVVVGRPEPSGDDEQVGRQPLAKRRLQLLGLVSDERDPRGLEAPPRQLLGEKGAVRVAAPAPHELAACDDDRSAGSQRTGGASETRFGVTSSHRRAPVPAPGTTCGFPFRRRRRLAGAKT